MSLPYDYSRCSGYECPIKESCLRYTDKAKGAHPMQISWFMRPPYKHKSQTCDEFIRELGK